MTQYRQGDVYLRSVAEIPKDAKPVKRAAGRVVLAYGEVTGHAHAITESGVALLEAPGKRYLRVEEPAAIQHEEHSTIHVAPGLYEVVIQREYDDAEEFRRVAD